MNYPYGPQEGPTPGGYPAPYPAHPGQPYGQPYPSPYAPMPGGYPPGYPYGGPGFGQPSGATAIPAGLLAVGLAVLCGHSAFRAFDAADKIEKASNRLGMGSAQDSIGGLQTIGALNTIFGVLWLLGGLLLISRKSAGRTMLILLACIGGISSLYSGIASADSEVPAAAIGSFIGLGVAALILGLSLAGSTARWLASAPRRPRPYGQPTPYGQPLYGQPTPPQPVPPQGQPQYPPHR
ncbi:hypothetical protein ACFYT3_14220 [Nocardia amikacinitolerans]|uniref:hypothetical protein n=1 Tax=Nocardia amikacinitolerans TaxID=756689 RepID=UPI0020A593F9|nr:hypothetical protein [Nocardia amikacinitolerans]MCP2290762.1 hypothetical protein [Nocardia amikacinitolerans]